MSPTEIIKREPDLVNELGIKFWHDPGFDKYTKKVPKSVVYLVQHPPNDWMEWLVIIGGKPEYSSQSSEAIVCHLEALRISRQRWKA